MVFAQMPEGDADPIVRLNEYGEGVDVLHLLFDFYAVRVRIQKNDYPLVV